MRALVVILLCGLLFGCTHELVAPPVAKAPKVAWKRYQHDLYAINSWTASGELGVVTPKQAINANVDWTQNNKVYTIELFGPLGLGATSITNASGRVVLDEAGNKTVSAENPEFLMDRQLGWSVPVLGLIYWARGLPIPNAPKAYTLNQYGTLTALEQDGWSIRYDKYRLFNNVPLPTLIQLHTGGVHVVIAVNQWQVSPS